MKSRALQIQSGWEPHACRQHQQRPHSMPATVVRVTGFLHHTLHGHADPPSALWLQDMGAQRVVLHHAVAHLGRNRKWKPEERGETQKPKLLLHLEWWRRWQMGESPGCANLPFTTLISIMYSAFTFLPKHKRQWPWLWRVLSSFPRKNWGKTTNPVGNINGM